MARIDHSSLLKFLVKPRFAREVAEHYGISKKIANFHLREAIKKGQVLVSEKPLSQILKGSNRKLRASRAPLYVSRKSPMIVGGWAKAKSADGPILTPKSNLSNIRFLSPTHSALGKDVVNSKLSGFAFEEKTDSSIAKHNLKTKGALAPEFDASSDKVKLAERKNIDQLLGHKPSTQTKTTSLSYVEKIRLFQALSKKSLTFLDLHGRFGVSKQTIKGFVKNGFLAETWEPQGIGVKFKLTSKGKIHLKELEAAAKYEPKLTEKPLIRLKQKIFL